MWVVSLEGGAGGSSIESETARMRTLHTLKPENLPRQSPKTTRAAVSRQAGGPRSSSCLGEAGGGS